MKKKIIYADYIEFKNEYYNTDAYNHQRFGQAFCNGFFIQDSELFYQKDEQKAINIIFARYIDWGGY